MEISFQLLDCDYIIINNSPIIRLFGKTRDNKTVCAFYDNFLPYFYVLPEDGKQEDVIKFLGDRFRNLVVRIKEVKKFLPMGFRKEKTNLLEITLKSPVEVRKIRNELKSQKFVREVYEADILFKYRFMVDFGLSGMKWVKVVGDGINTSTVKTDIVINAESIQVVEEESSADLKYIGIDIEVVAGKEGVPDSSRDKVAMISLSFFPNFNSHNTLVLVSKITKKIDKDIIICKNEKDMLEQFIKIIDSFDPDIICGYNINNFDIPFISERLRINKISRALGRCKQKQLNCRKIGIWFRNSITGRIIVDVYELIKESVGKGLLRLKRYGLGDVSKELLGEEKVDIAHSEIEKYWNGDDAQFKKLIDYSKKDAELVLKLLLRKDMLGKFIELSKVSGLLLQDVLSGGESIRVENLLLREFDKRDYILLCKPDEKEIQRRIAEREIKGLKGALVLEPDVGLHTDCVVYLDFKSMYPSILIAWNICPTTLILNKEKVKYVATPYGAKFVSKEIKQGIIPTILNYLIKERDKIKNEMKKSLKLKKILGARQYALKIMANAFYGYMGYVRARLYILDIANAITSCGRELIQKTKNIVETDNNLKVVYGDTDSVMVKLQTKDLEEALKIGEIVEERINKKLKEIVKIKTESIFKTLLILTKKRYAGWGFEKINGKWHDIVLMKGIETVRRDWCDLTSKTLYNILEILLKEQDTKKAFRYVKDIITKLERNEIPIEELVITKSISKPLRQYKGIQPHIELVKKLRKRNPANVPGVGDRVGFVIIKGLRLLSDRAEDPEYVKQKGLKIDSKYYIENQILPPLERVFEAIGIEKSELIGMGRQMLLTDAIKKARGKEENELNKIEGFVCNKCNRTFRRPPLIGKCFSCGGEIFFYSGENRSRYFNP